ncbi:MAG: type II secretion system minor pseudopilin GspH [Gammaproteobacteria bacterium]
MAGFTLIEILVVVFIIAIVALATSLTIGNTRGGRVVKQEANHLQRYLQLVGQTAIIDQMDLGVGIWSTGYAVWKYDYTNKKWMLITDDRALKEYDLPEPLRITLRSEQLLGALPNTLQGVRVPQIGFSATGSATPVTVVISNEEIHYDVEIANNGETKILENE